VVRHIRVRQNRQNPFRGDCLYNIELHKGYVVKVLGYKNCVSYPMIEQREFPSVNRLQHVVQNGYFSKVIVEYNVVQFLNV
jgi:hypothetical protein